MKILLLNKSKANLNGSPFLSLFQKLNHISLLHQNSGIMIHVSKLFELVQTHKTFSIEWVNERGGIEVVDDASYTSWHSEGNSFNIICNKSGQVRTVNKLTVTKFNGEEVFR